MKLLFLSIFIISLQNQITYGQNIIHSHCCEDYCYSSDKERPQRKYFASKTSYSSVRGAEFGRQYAVPFCKPVKFWMLGRHGTRLPEDYIIVKLEQLELLRDEIIKNYEHWRSQPTTGGLCPEDLKLIKNWVLDRNITTEHSKYLTIQGWNDMKLLAKSYKRIFPDLLASKYEPDKFLFRHENNQRNEGSYKAFVEGLFGSDALKNISLPPMSERNTLLAPHNECPAWLDQNKRKSDPGSEVYKFRKSAIMNRTISNVSIRLGFQYLLDYRQIELMWDMCRYEHAWFVDSPSAWCTAFTLTDHQVLEFLQDLRNEYGAGYVSDINSNVPCEVVQDMLKHLNSNTNPRVIGHFSDSTLLQLFLVALGAFKDDVLLTSSNFHVMANRKWRTSVMDPFGANIAAVKYDCSRDRQDPSTKVKFFLNQRPLEMNWCKSGLCKWSDVMHKNEKYWKNNCNDVFCTRNSASIFYRSIKLVFVFTALLHMIVINFGN